MLPVGCSDHRGVVSFYYNHATDAAATTVGGFWAGPNSKSLKRSIVVDCADKMIEAAVEGPVSFIKIDVEGGELEVLCGLVDTINRHAPPIMMEILPASCDLDAKDASSIKSVQLRLARIEKLTSLLSSLGLTAFRLMLTGELVSTVEFDSATFDPALTNYLLLPKNSPLHVDEISRVFSGKLGGKRR